MSEEDAELLSKNRVPGCITKKTADRNKGAVVVAADLPCSLAADNTAPQRLLHIPAVTYPVGVSIFRDEIVGLHMCTARLKNKETQSVFYELAKPTEERTAVKSKTEVMAGFPVDARMMCFCDAKGVEEYRAFLDQQHSDNEGKNHYKDYFAESLQRVTGSFLFNANLFE